MCASYDTSLKPVNASGGNHETTCTSGPHFGFHSAEYEELFGFGAHCKGLTLKSSLLWCLTLDSKRTS